MGLLTASDFKTAQRKSFVLVDTPSIHVADTKLINTQSELSFPRLLLEEIDFLAILLQVFVVGDFETGGIRSFAEPHHAFFLVGSHSPTVPAGEGVQEHAGGVVLAGCETEMVG